MNQVKNKKIQQIKFSSTFFWTKIGNWLLVLLKLIKICA